jgi:hypothetical protein
VWAFQLIVLFGKDNRASETSLFLEILLVNGSLGKIGLYVVKLAHVPAAAAFRTETSLPTVVHKVDLGEFGHGLIEGSADGLLVVGDDLVAPGRVELLGGFVHLFVEVGALIELALGLRQSSNSGS